MLRQAKRTTILELQAQGVSKRETARVLGTSRVGGLLSRCHSSLSGERDQPQCRHKLERKHTGHTAMNEGTLLDLISDFH